MSSLSDISKMRPLKAWRPVWLDLTGACSATAH